METIVRLDKVAGASDPRMVLASAWESILDKDYAPVFRPTLAVLGTRLVVLPISVRAPIRTTKLTPPARISTRFRRGRRTIETAFPPNRQYC